MSFFNFHTAGHLLFGNGAVARLGEHARGLEIEKILIILKKTVIIALSILILRKQKTHGHDHFKAGSSRS